MLTITQYPRICTYKETGEFIKHIFGLKETILTIENIIILFKLMDHFLFRSENFPYGIRGKTK